MLGAARQLPALEVELEAPATHVKRLRVYGEVVEVQLQGVKF